MRDGLADLVMTLGDVGGAEYIADITHLQRLPQIHAELEVIGRIQRGDSANPLRAEAGSGAVSGADIEGDAEKSDVVFADLAHVFQVMGLEERVDPGPVRKFTALEATDLGLVLNGVHALESKFLGSANLLLPLPRRDRALLAQSPHPFQIRQGQFSLVFSMPGGMTLIK